MLNKLLVIAIVGAAGAGAINQLPSQNDMDGAFDDLRLIHEVTEQKAIAMAKVTGKQPEEFLHPKRMSADEIDGRQQKVNRILSADHEHRDTLIRETKGVLSKTELDASYDELLANLKAIIEKHESQVKYTGE